MIASLGKVCRIAVIAGSLMLASCSKAPSAPPAAKTEFSIGWSIYAGWMPWAYAEKSGILKKWADRYGIKIHLIQVNDYVESVNQYTAGKLDGVAVTNMDALTIPAAGGKDTTSLIIGDYSNGNDGIVLKANLNEAGPAQLGDDPRRHHRRRHRSRDPAIRRARIGDRQRRRPVHQLRLPRHHRDAPPGGSDAVAHRDLGAVDGDDAR